MPSTTGSANKSKRRVWAILIRPDGSGLHGLLTVSSTTDSGCLWLARSKMRRFNQFHRITDGSLLKTFRRSGEALLVKRGPESAAAIPNNVSGNTKVAKSLSVKSQSVLTRASKANRGRTCQIQHYCHSCYSRWYENNVLTGGDFVWAWPSRQSLFDASFRDTLIFYWRYPWIRSRRRSESLGNNNGDDALSYLDVNRCNHKTEHVLLSIAWVLTLRVHSIT